MRGMEGLVSVKIALRINEGYWDKLDLEERRSLRTWFKKNQEKMVSKKSKNFKEEKKVKHKETRKLLRELKKFNNNRDGVTDYYGSGGKVLPFSINISTLKRLTAIRKKAERKNRKEGSLTNTAKIEVFKGLIKETIKTLKEEEERNLELRRKAREGERRSYFFSGLSYENWSSTGEIFLEFEVYNIGDFDFSSFVKSIKISARMIISHCLKEDALNGSRDFGYLKGFKWKKGFGVITHYEAFVKSRKKKEVEAA